MPRKQTTSLQLTKQKQSMAIKIPDLNTEKQRSIFIAKETFQYQILDWGNCIYMVFMGKILMLNCIYIFSNLIDMFLIL